MFFKHWIKITQAYKQNNFQLS